MMQFNLSDVNFLLECIKAKEEQAGHEKMSALFGGLLSSKDSDEKAKEISDKMEDIENKHKNHEEQMTILKAKLYQLRDSLKMNKVYDEASDIIAGNK